MITIKIDNAYSQLTDLNDLFVIDRISQELSYSKNSAMWAAMHSNWDGVYHLLNKKLQFPTGCVPRVRRILDQLAQEYEIEDRRAWGDMGRPQKWNGYDLYDYQKEIVGVCLDKKHGMVKAATGSGKTTVISKLVSEFNLPTVIYVVSIDLLDQMRETLERSLSTPIGVVGDGRCDIQKITVCSAWTPGKLFTKNKIKNEEEVKDDKWVPGSQQGQAIKEMVKNAKVVILDEAQFAAAETIRVLLNNSVSAGHRFGFSGTPWRADGDDLLLEAAFGPTIYDLPASNLIRQGYLVAPYIFYKDIPKISFPNPNYAAVKKEYIVAHRARNELLIRAVVDLLHRGRKPLLIFKEHAHGHTLCSLLPPDIRYHLVTGKLKGEERTRIRKSFLDGKVDLLVASTVYDQGVDLPALDALILSAGGKSTGKALQRVGRVIRSYQGKKDSIVIDTFDQAPFLKEHSLSRYRIFKTEPEFRIKTDKAFNQLLERKGHGY